MSESDVTEVLEVLGSAGIDVCVDGGWGVDALLEEQTRRHDDLDVVVALVDCDRVASAFGPLGFRAVTDERPTRLVLGDDGDRRIDLHTVVFDGNGDGYQSRPDGSRYPYGQTALSGRGRIGDRPVACLTAEVQIECHLGYQADETGHHDMKLLGSRFRLPLPAPYTTPEAGR